MTARQPKLLPLKDCFSDVHSKRYLRNNEFHSLGSRYKKNPSALCCCGLCWLDSQEMLLCQMILSGFPRMTSNTSVKSGHSSWGRGANPAQLTAANFILGYCTFKKKKKIEMSVSFQLQRGRGCVWVWLGGRGGGDSGEKLIGLKPQYYDIGSSVCVYIGFQIRQVSWWATRKGGIWLQDPLDPVTGWKFQRPPVHFSELASC